jgi:hypothetical protein
LINASAAIVNKLSFFAVGDEAIKTAAKQGTLTAANWANAASWWAIAAPIAAVVVVVGLLVFGIIKLV